MILCAALLSHGQASPGSSISTAPLALQASSLCCADFSAPFSVCSQAYHLYAFLCIFLAWHLSSFPPPFQCICLLSFKCTPKISHSIKKKKERRRCNPGLTNIIFSHSQIGLKVQAGTRSWCASQCALGDRWEVNLFLSLIALAAIKRSKSKWVWGFFF